MKNFLALLFIFNTFALSAQIDSLTPDFRLLRIAAGVYVHEHSTTIEPFGRVASNGLVYCVAGECLVFDTPLDDPHAALLIDWVETTLGARVKGVVVNHFHADCLGGLAEFHRRGIPSFSSKLTRTLARADSVEVPQNGFGRKKTLRVGGEKVELRYFGKAHSPDNIIAWLPAERILFGGCMVKALGAGKGNLGDADVTAWPLTIQKIKTHYPEVQIVIPGHGTSGDKALLDFTIELFSR